MTVPADLKTHPAARRMAVAERLGPENYRRFIEGLRAERREIYQRLKEASAATRAAAALCLCGAAHPGVP